MGLAQEKSRTSQLEEAKEDLQFKVKKGVSGFVRGKKREKSH